MGAIGARAKKLTERLLVVLESGMTDQSCLSQATL